VVFGMVRANQPEDPDLLCEMDQRIFSPADCFSDPVLWEEYRSYWIIGDERRVGSVALGPGLAFSGDPEEDKREPGSLYLASIGVLPEERRKGASSFALGWIYYFALSGDDGCSFRRISSNCRRSNDPSLCLHLKRGFKVLRSVEGFYKDPVEAAI
jgi:GNAT superfamily N-acetyltransferase